MRSLRVILRSRWLITAVGSLSLYSAWVQAQTPQISNVTPTSGAAGVQVTISGSNFGANLASITFNGTGAIASSWSDGSITVQVPVGATSGNVVITVGGLSSNGAAFTVLNPGFTPTGSLTTGRMFHTATLLNTGRVLVVGGVDGFTYNPINSAELYDPATGIFSPAGNLNSGRIFNTATLLADGTVLIVGGTDSNWNNIAPAELYDPASGNFKYVGALNDPRGSHTATLLSSGKVLITGGVDSNGDYITSLAAVSELYDPTVQSFTPTGTLNLARDCHTATLLNNGQVLIVGGLDVNGNVLASVEIYDPTSGSYTGTGSLNFARAVHTAALLNNGQVLIAGGYDNNGNAVASAELYDPISGTFSVTGSMVTPRYDGPWPAALLSNGTVLIAGGQDTNGNTLASAELFDPASGTFSIAGNMSTTRQSLTTTLLSNGQVLAAGGMDYNANVLASAEVYQPSSLAPPGLVSIALSPGDQSIADGTSQTLTATGTFSDGSTQSLSSVTWSSSDSTILAVSNDITNHGVAYALGTGSVVVTACAGPVCGATEWTVTPIITSLNPASGPVGASVTVSGFGFGSAQGSNTVTIGGIAASVSNWSTNSVTMTVPMAATTGNVVVTANGVPSNGVVFVVPRLLQLVTVTPTTPVIQPGATQQFLAIGTYSDGSTQDLTSAVTWSSSAPGTATITSTGLATAVATGQTTIQATIGAITGSATLSISTATGTFSLTGNMNTARTSQLATLLNNGTVLIVGGYGAKNQAVASAELYDPTKGTFTPTASPKYPHYGGTASLLSNGMVLIAGGSDGSGNTLASAEVYDPGTGAFTSTGSLTVGRTYHTATVQNDGEVLIVGGYDSNFNTLASAELYNPATGTFTAVGNLNTERVYQTATLLNSGKILITGGTSNSLNAETSVEIYDPTAKSFAVTSPMNVGRNSHTATLLNNGLVLVAAGYDANFNVLGSAELYDPSAGLFNYTGSLNTPRDAYAVSMLTNGTVLFSAGFDSNYNTIASAEVYDPASGTFAYCGTLNTGRWGETSNLLENGTVLVAGGQDINNKFLTSAELYQPNTLTPPNLVSISIGSPGDPSVPVATSQSLAAVGTFSDNSTQTLASLVWSSSNRSVATVTSDSTNSGQTFGVTAGSATINACAGSICGSTSITVTPAQLTAITIAPGNQTITIGASVSFIATGTFSNGGSQDLSAFVSWNSSSPVVASVNTTGLASGLATGTATITASYDGMNASVTLTVKPPLTSIAVSPSNDYIAIGNIQQFAAIGTYLDGSQADITSAVNWTLSNSQVATISSTGSMSALAAGTITITASSGGISSSANLTVTPSALTSISISPQSLSLPIGMSSQLAANAMFADGSVINISGQVVWNSSASSVATIGLTGKTTSVSQGTTTISATFGIFVASTAVTVSAPALVSAVMSPQNLFLPPNSSQQFTLVGTYSDGTSQDITSLASWSSSAPSVANVSGAGLVTGASAGTANISANAGGLGFLVNVTVTSAGPPSITATTSPAPNAAGWNNANVTVTFTCTPGGAAIVSCPASQLVSSEGANQVISGTVTDASGATANTTVTVNVDKTPPILAVASPTDGSTIMTSNVVATGTLSDALSGVASLTCNGATVAYAGMNFSCDLPLNPGLNLVVVRSVDVAGNVALTKMHVTNPNYPQPTSVQITPTNANPTVGQTQQFTAIDDQGRPRPDATWQVSDSAIATIDTNSSTTLRAIAPGQVTLTATVSAVSSQININILGGIPSSGTPTWAGFPLSGDVALDLYPAVPSRSATAIYSTESSFDGATNTVRAFTNDGQQIWQQSSQGNIPSRVVSGFDGPLLEPVAYGPGRLSVADDQTGSTVWKNTILGSGSTSRPDGTFVTLGGDSQDQPPGPGGLFLINGATGQSTNLPYPDMSTGLFTETAFCNGPGGAFVPGTTTNTVVPTVNGTITTDSSGNSYVEYVVSDIKSTDTEQAVQDQFGNWGCAPSAYAMHAKYVAKIMTIFPGGNTSAQVLASSTYTDVLSGASYVQSGWVLIPGAITPDGQGGLLATWQTQSPADNTSQFMVSHITSTGQADFHLAPLDQAPDLSAPVVLNEAGVGYIASAPDSAVLGTVISFDINSGQVHWIQQPAFVSEADSLIAQDGGGVIFRGSDSAGNSGMISIDSVGNMGPFLITGPSGTRVPRDSWTGEWYSVGPALAAIPFNINPVGSWIQASGNPSRTDSPRSPVVDTFEPFDPDAIRMLAVDFPRRYAQIKNLKGTFISELITSVPRLLTEATWKKFQTRPQTVAAIGYIGHSLVPPTAPAFPNRAVGLCFYDMLAERAAVPGDPEYSQVGFDGYIGDPPCPLVTDYPAAPLAIQPKVLFISACEMDANMQNFLGINDNTAGRWLVIPVDVTEVLLGMGEYEWLQILHYLTSGQNLQNAVNNANLDVLNAAPWKDSSGKIHPPEAWKVIGNNHDGGAGFQF